MKSLLFVSNASCSVVETFKFKTLGGLTTHTLVGLSVTLSRKE